MGSVIITVNDDWKGFGVIELAAGISYDDVGFWWSTDCLLFRRRLFASPSYTFLYRKSRNQTRSQVK